MDINNPDAVVKALNSPRLLAYAGMALDMPDEFDKIVLGDYVYEYGVIDESESDGIPYEHFGWSILCPACDFQKLYPSGQATVVKRTSVVGVSESEARNRALDEAAELCLAMSGALNNSGACSIAIRKLKTPCSDCGQSGCTMNCGPVITKATGA